MKLQDYNARVDQLINLAGVVLASKHPRHADMLSTELFGEFRTASLSFLRTVFGTNHPFYEDFNKNVRDVEFYMVEQGRGILKAAKTEIQDGWLFTVKSLVSGEIFSDFLEMAEYLLSEGFKDPAAVMIGSVLEEHLRQLCTKNGIHLEIDRGGKMILKRADAINAELAAANVYNKLDQKSVTSWLDLRNKAAHGKYDNYSRDQVSLYYDSVLNFISRTS